MQFWFFCWKTSGKEEEKAAPPTYASKAHGNLFIVSDHNLWFNFSEGHDTTTAQANTQARAGALMAHHPASVGHHTGGSRSKPTVHPCPLRWGGCGLLTSTPTHNDEPKKTQHNDHIVAEQVLCDLSVRRASVVRPLGAQNSVCSWSVQTILMCAIRSEAMTSPMSCPARKHCDSASLGSARTRWSATTRS